MLQKQTTIVFSIGLIALMVSAGACAFLFLEIKQKNERIAELFAENSLAATKDQQYKILQQVLEDTKNERELIDFHVIPPDGVVPFIEFVEKLGSENGVALKIDSIEPDTWKNKKNARIEALKVNVTATGNWQSIYRFLSQIEYMPYVIYIEQIQLEKVSEEASSYWRTSFKFSVVKEK